MIILVWDEAAFSFANSEIIPLINPTDKICQGSGILHVRKLSRNFQPDLVYGQFERGLAERFYCDRHPFTFMESGIGSSAVLQCARQGLD